jgi:DNA-binding transcriptional LysR family regulator
MDRVKAMEVFIEVVRQRGFAPAARELQMSTSAVSRYIIDLEELLDVQLLNRTTRQLHMTETGRSYLPLFRQIVGEVENLTYKSKKLHENPQGEIKITTPIFLGTHFLGPILPKFLKKYPNVKVNIYAADRFVNLVEEGYDLALRIAKLPDSNLIARTLSECRLLLTAAPTYVKQHGIPETIDDLKNHNCIADNTPGRGDWWSLIGGKGSQSIHIQGNIIVNNGEMVREMTLAGVGISLLPDFIIARDVAKKKLISFLDDNINYKATISAIYPQSKHLSSTIRVFVDFLVEHKNNLRALC